MLKSINVKGKKVNLVLFLRNQKDTKFRLNMNNDNSMDRVEGEVNENDLSKDALNNRFINKNHVKYDSSDEEH